MTQATLALGSFALAFGPLLSMFAWIVYPKAQLVILVTTSAFFYLLAATASSVTWMLFSKVLDINGIPALTVILPSVLFQFLFRCGFAALYHKVERVIQQSLHKQNEEERKNQSHTNNNNSSGNDAEFTTPSATPTGSSSSFTEAARLRLELNDGTAAIAAAVGFGGMHAILLYGTLLASEITNNVGVLYQDSCPNVPSLAVSAVLTNLFSVLQVFWMLLTFFGMRRRLMFHRGQSAATLASMNSAVAATSTTTPSSRCSGSWLGNSRNGGNCALLWVLVSHLSAAMFTNFNAQSNGCRIVIPTVGATLIVTAYLFWAGCGRIYMPPSSVSSRHRD